MNTLFHHNGDGNPGLIWELFREAVKGIDSVSPDHFERALDIGGVATRKLTQALFLVNPEEFLPFDDQVKPLKLFDSVAFPDSWANFQISWKDYRKWLEEARASFPGCWLCEAHLIAWLLSPSNELPVSVLASNCFQVSTNVFGDDTDRWDDFDAENCVYTGGPGGKKAYPLDKPKTGDIILTRFGRTGGRGIGVVHRNDYRDGFAENRRLHVVWLNKTPSSRGRRSISGPRTASWRTKIASSTSDCPTTIDDGRTPESTAGSTEARPAGSRRNRKTLDA